MPASLLVLTICLPLPIIPGVLGRLAGCKAAADAGEFPETIGIDTPEDLARAEEFLKAQSVNP